MQLLSLVLAVDILKKINTEDLKYRKQMKMKILRQEASPFKYFTQPVSHFQSNSAETWQQAYYSTSVSRNESEYAILYIGGEGPLGVESGDSVISRLAKRLNAVQYGVEHRGYAENSSFPVQFVTADEAVEDLATFANSFGPTKKWILIGGSYSGSLVHYTVGKYPELFHTGWSSSAPLHAKEDFYEYDQVVARALPPGCRRMVRLATVEMDRVQKEDRKKLDSWKMKTFETTEIDDVEFLSSFGYAVSGEIQYNYFPSDYVAELCKGTESAVFEESDAESDVDESEDESDYTPSEDDWSDDGSDDEEENRFNKKASRRVAKKLRKHKRSFKGKSTSSNLDDFIAKYIKFVIATAEEAGDPNASIKWGYQCCTQFGWWQIAPEKDSLRTELLTKKWSREAYCDGQYPELLGNVTNPALPRTELMNSRYSTTKLLNKVIYVNGDLDPWITRCWYYWWKDLWSC
eukprot:NODE_776_length_3975_cov_0.468008.p1 type:complete len:462 gc:universal NODE_776_length_3975_cov_0.468008:1407-22(-)